jgi:hypothetical protein
VDSKAGLNDMEKRKFLILPGLDLRPLHRLARSQSLYRLRYPLLWTSSFFTVIEFDTVYQVRFVSNQVDVSFLAHTILN